VDGEERDGEVGGREKRRGMGAVGGPLLGIGSGIDLVKGGSFMWGEKGGEVSEGVSWLGALGEGWRRG